MATKGSSMGISTSELYGASTNTPEAIWSGVSQGLAGLAAAYRTVEQQRAANRDVGMEAFISALETRGQDVASQRRRDTGYAAGGLLLERDTTSYLANLAKSDVSTQAEKYAQAKIAMGRETASKNFVAQMTLTPYMDYVTNSASHAGRALAVEAIRSSPVFSDTSAAFKNSLQRVNETAINVGDGKKYGVATDLNGGPATYQAMASTILDERADPETQVNATASLIMLSTAIGDAIPDSELARFVSPDVLQCAKARVAAFTRLGGDATTMGFMSDRGMEKLDGMVRNAEDVLAGLGYKVDAEGVVFPANEVTRETYNKAVEEAAANNGTVSLPESVMTAAQGVIQARHQQRNLQKLWDEVQALGTAGLRSAWEQGNLPAFTAFNQSITAQVTSRAMAVEEAEGLTQQAQYHIGKAASAMEINRDRSRLGDSLMDSYGFTDDFRSKPRGFFWTISPTGKRKEVDEALGRALASLRSELGLDDSVKLGDLDDPRTINRVVGRAAAEQLVKNNSMVRTAFVGDGGLPTPGDDADEIAAIKLLGDKIGERLTDRLENKPVYSTDDNGNRTWQLLRGEVSEGFDGVVRSVVADALVDVADVQFLEHEALLDATYKRGGVNLTGTENRAPRYMLANAGQKYALSPADRKVKAADPVDLLPVAKAREYARQNPEANAITVPEMSVDSAEEVETVNTESNGVYAYQVSAWEGDNYVTKRPVLPQGTPMPGVFFRDPDAPGGGKPGISFGKAPDSSVRVRGGEGPRLRALEFSPMYGVGNTHTHIPSCPVMMAGFLKDEPQADIAFYGSDRRLPELTPDMVFTESQLAAGKQVMDVIAPAIAKIYEDAFSAETSGDERYSSLDLTTGMAYSGMAARYKYSDTGRGEMHYVAPSPSASPAMSNLVSLGDAVSRLPKLSADDSSLDVVRRELQVKSGEALVVSLAQLLDVGFRARSSESVDSASVTGGVIAALKSADKNGSITRLAAVAGLPPDWLEQFSVLDVNKYVDEYRKQNGKLEGGFFLTFLHDLGASYVPPSISVDMKISPVDLTTLIHRGANASWAPASALATSAPPAANAPPPGVSAYPGATVNLPPEAKGKSNKTPPNLGAQVRPAGTPDSTTVDG